MKRIGITAGDPAGIGAEVTLKALNALFEKTGFKDASFHIFAGAKFLAETAKKLKLAWLLEKYGVEVIDLAGSRTFSIKPGAASRDSGELAAASIKKAVDYALNGKIDALVTAPISKEALKLAGYGWPGHTEMLAELTGARDAQMVFYGPGMRLVLVTRHLALRDAINTLSPEKIESGIMTAAAYMKKLFPKKKDFEIIVCGLNPHAGENGLFGNEETKIIAPAIKNAQKKINLEYSKNKIFINGPLPADTAFYRTARVRKSSVVVALYHDQGLIPFKMLYFNSGVNVTLGLPFLRTSPDHGTAFDIAGRGAADCGSMLCALKLALKMTVNK